MNDKEKSVYKTGDYIKILEKQYSSSIEKLGKVVGVFKEDNIFKIKIATFSTGHYDLTWGIIDYPSNGTDTKLEIALFKSPDEEKIFKENVLIQLDKEIQEATKSLSEKEKKKVSFLRCFGDHLNDDKLDLIRSK